MQDTKVIGILDQFNAAFTCTCEEILSSTNVALEYNVHVHVLFFLVDIPQLLSHELTLFLGSCSSYNTYHGNAFNQFNQSAGEVCHTYCVGHTFPNTTKYFENSRKPDPFIFLTLRYPPESCFFPTFSHYQFILLNFL